MLKKSISYYYGWAGILFAVASFINFVIRDVIDGLVYLGLTFLFVMLWYSQKGKAG